MSRIRTTLAIKYKDEVRDLTVTFDVIDRVRAIVPWEQLAVEFEKDAPVPNFTMLAKFVYHNLKAAGFKVGEEDLETIYDEMLQGEDNTSYIQLVGQLLTAYMPKGSKKKPPAAPLKKATKKAS